MRNAHPRYLCYPSVIPVGVETSVTVFPRDLSRRFLAEKEYEYRLRVTGEQQANALLGSLIADGISVITFDLREPSLHEIFVETVGGEADEDA